MSVREITYAEALREALREEMTRDPDVFLMGEDIAQHGNIFGVTQGLYEEFGLERVRNTPISEGTIVGAGLGAALTGARPVVEIMYMDFAALAMDQIVNQAAKVRYMFGGRAEAPLVIRTQGGGGRGNAAQHSQSLEMWFIHTPGLVVVQPATPFDAKGLLKSAIRSNDPVIFLEHKLLYAARGPVPEEEYLVPIGTAEVKRKGHDVTVVATSRMVLLALEAADLLKREGISAEIIDPRTLKPLDLDVITASVNQTGRLVAICEGHRTGSFASELATRVMERCFDYLEVPIECVCTEDVPIPYNRRLETEALPQVKDIVEAAQRACSG